jgi:hypothetical protein
MGSVRIRVQIISILQEKLCRNWIRRRMTQNSNRNHRIGPAGTLARGPESAIHASTGYPDPVRIHPLRISGPRIERWSGGLDSCGCLPPPPGPHCTVSSPLWRFAARSSRGRADPRGPTCSGGSEHAPLEVELTPGPHCIVTALAVRNTLLSRSS